MIPVTKPFLPPRKEYESYVKEIWDRNWLTNDGPLVKELEEKLGEYLGVGSPLFVSNGTIALQLAIKALGLDGEIITTPFSYVATTSSIVWEGCTPVFVDIDENTLNIDPAKIEDAVTGRTSAILATHVFGNPCDIEAIAEVADKLDLKVIYDAAHAFGTTYKGKSIFEYGDISITSFHATKLFHTVEGGAVFSGSREVLEDIAYMRNFGHDGPAKYAMVGINGKNTEFHAAMGLCNLKYMDEVIVRRKEQCELYFEHLEDLPLTHPSVTDHSEINYAYFPVLFESEAALLKTEKALQENRIYPRRYFYPSLDELPYVAQTDLPVCRSVAERVMCLPLYHDISEQEIKQVCQTMAQSLGHRAYEL